MFVIEWLLFIIEKVGFLLMVLKILIVLIVNFFFLKMFIGLLVIIIFVFISILWYFFMVFEFMLRMGYWLNSFFLLFRRLILRCLFL